MRKACQFSCTKYSGPEIHSLGLNDYVIVHPKHSLIVDCPRSSVLLPAVPVGASKINIPCDCILRVDSTVLIDTQFPCDPRLNNVFNRTVILPSLWSKTRKPWSSEPEKYIHPALTVSHVVSKNLSFTLPDFVIMSAPQKPKEKVQILLPALQMNVYVMCGVLFTLQIILFVWVAFLQRSFCGNCARLPKPAFSHSVKTKKRKSARVEFETDPNEIELQDFTSRYARRF